MTKDKISLKEFLSYDYPLIVRNYNDEENGEEGIVISCPELNGLEVFGETYEEAFSELIEAKIALYELAEELGEEINPPLNHANHSYSGRLTLRLPKSLHQQIDIYAKKEEVSLNSAITYLITRGLYNSKEDKILDKLDKIGKTLNIKLLFETKSHQEKPRNPFSIDSFRFSSKSMSNQFQEFQSITFDKGIGGFQ